MENLEARLSNFFSKFYPHIQGWGIVDFKIKNGIKYPGKTIRIIVNKKLPKHKLVNKFWLLLSEHITGKKVGYECWKRHFYKEHKGFFLIPESIGGIQTDVVEGEFWLERMPSKTDTTRYPTIEGGMAVSGEALGVGSFGTNGAVAFYKDKAGAVTNAHVTYVPGETVYQPYYGHNNDIGTNEPKVLILPPEWNKRFGVAAPGDFAFYWLNGKRPHKELSILEIGNFNPEYEPPKVTDQRFVIKRGATAYDNADFYMLGKITDGPFEITVGGYEPGHKSGRIKNCYTITSLDGRPFAGGGNSGSLILWADTKKPTLHLFAGGRVGGRDVTIAYDIGPVMKLAGFSFAPGQGLAEPPDLTKPIQPPEEDCVDAFVKCYSKHAHLGHLGFILCLLEFWLCGLRFMAGRRRKRLAQDLEDLRNLTKHLIESLGSRQSEA